MKHPGNAPNAPDASAMIMSEDATGARSMSASSAGTSTNPAQFMKKANARADLEQILSKESFGRLWLILDGTAPVAYIIIVLG